VGSRAAPHARPRNLANDGPQSSQCTMAAKHHHGWHRGAQSSACPAISSPRVATVSCLFGAAIVAPSTSPPSAVPCGARARPSPSRSRAHMYFAPRVHNTQIQTLARGARAHGVSVAFALHVAGKTRNTKAEMVSFPFLVAHLPHPHAPQVPSTGALRLLRPNGTMADGLRVTPPASTSTTDSAGATTTARTAPSMYEWTWVTAGGQRMRHRRVPQPTPAGPAPAAPTVPAPGTPVSATAQIRPAAMGGTAIVVVHGGVSTVTVVAPPAALASPATTSAAVQEPLATPLAGASGLDDSHESAKRPGQRGYPTSEQKRT